MSQSSIEKPWINHYKNGINHTIPPIPYKSIPHMVNLICQKWSSNVAYSLLLPNGFYSNLTFKQIDELSDHFAIYLREICQLKKGQTVVLQLPNCLAYPIATFGVLKAGGVIVNTNPLYSIKEMEHQYADCQAEIVVIMDLFADKITEKFLKETKIKQVIKVSVADFFPFFKRILVKSVLKYIKKQVPKCEVNTTSFVDTISFGKKLKKEKEINTEKYWIDITLDDLFALQYTGGTTGVSKGAMLTHKNMLSNLFQVIELGKNHLEEGKDTILTALPLYHIFAFTVNFMTFFHAGCHNILVPNPRPLTNLKKAFEHFQITWLTGVNTLFNGLLRENWFINTKKMLKMSIGGGAAIHGAVIEEWHHIVGSPLIEGYGLTETSPLVCVNPLEKGLAKNGTIGIPVPGTTVAILDDNGTELSLGERGEIAVKGPQVMKGYWRHTEDTNLIFKNGWLLTGDIGVMDNDGYIKIVDRKKDMILVSGFNVYPNEVEDCIAKLSGIKEVAVIGAPSEKTGEFVKAFIVKDDQTITDKEILEHCKKHLTHYKLPRLIVFCSELPKSPIGKILRKELRKLSS